MARARWIIAFPAWRAQVEATTPRAALQAMAQAVALPARVALVANITDTMNHLLAHLSSPGELGTVFNVISRSMPSFLTQARSWLCGGGCVTVQYMTSLWCKLCVVCCIVMYFGCPWVCVRLCAFVLYKHVYTVRGHSCGHYVLSRLMSMLPMHFRVQGPHRGMHIVMRARAACDRARAAPGVRAAGERAAPDHLQRCARGGLRRLRATRRWQRDVALDFVSRALVSLHLIRCCSSV